jgi:hypothetical protein
MKDGSYADLPEDLENLLRFIYQIKQDAIPTSAKNFTSRFSQNQAS